MLHCSQADEEIRRNAQGSASSRERPCAFWTSEQGAQARLRRGGDVDGQLEPGRSRRVDAGAEPDDGRQCARRREISSGLRLSTPDVRLSRLMTGGLISCTRGGFSCRVRCFGRMEDGDTLLRHQTKDPVFRSTAGESGRERRFSYRVSAVTPGAVGSGSGSRRRTWRGGA